jgi:hypothetical protein
MTDVNPKDVIALALAAGFDTTDFERQLAARSHPANQVGYGPQPRFAGGSAAPMDAQTRAFADQMRAAIDKSGWSSVDLNGRPIPSKD